MASLRVVHRPLVGRSGAPVLPVSARSGTWVGAQPTCPVVHRPLEGGRERHGPAMHRWLPVVGSAPSSTPSVTLGPRVGALQAPSHSAAARSSGRRHIVPARGRLRATSRFMQRKEYLAHGPVKNPDRAHVHARWPSLGVNFPPVEGELLAEPQDIASSARAAQPLSQRCAASISQARLARHSAAAPWYHIEGGVST